MTEEQLKALLKMVKGDTSLQEKFKAAASPDAAVEIAKDAGFAITAITIFFFAITIIGPHTTVQANQGCNRECQDCDDEGRCDEIPSVDQLPGGVKPIPAGVQPGRVPRINMEPMEMPSMEPMEGIGIEEFPDRGPMEMPEGPMEMPRGIDKFSDMEPMEKPIFERTKIPSIEPTEMPSFESISPDSPFGETCTPGSVLCEF